MTSNNMIGKQLIEEKKEKAIWDDKQVELFIKISIQEVREGNRPTTHFNRKGWCNLQTKFNKLASKNYDIKQFKNKWESLKKEWLIWKRLIGTETGLGWNATKKTIDASDDWWNQKIKEIPFAVKFREKGLLFSEELDLLFGDVVASGSNAWTPASGSLPRLYEFSNEDIQEDTINLEESADSDERSMDKNVNSSKIDSSINIHIKDKRYKDKGKRKHNSSSCSTSSKKKNTTIDIISKSFESLTDAVESYRRDVKEKVKDDGGLQASIDILNSLPIEKTSEFFLDCVTVLAKKKDFRKMLMILTMPEQQLGFLQRIVADPK